MATAISNIALLGIATFVALFLTVAALSSTSFYNVVVLACLLGFLLLSLLAPTRWKLRIVIVLISTGMTLLALEVILTTVEQGERGNTHAEAAERQGVFFDRRSRLEVVRDMVASGVDATVGASGGLYRTPVVDVDGREALPFGWISNRLTVGCNEGGEYSTYVSDEHGFRNPKGLWSSDRVDVALIGDSFVHGSCVQSGATIASKLRNEYPNTVNLGMVGTGPLSQLAVLREYLPVLKPDTVLWFYYEGNDLQDLKLENIHFPLLRPYLEPGYHLDMVSNQADIDRGIEASVKLAIAKQDTGDSSWGIPSWGYIFNRVQLDSLRLRTVRAFQGGDCGGSYDDTWVLFDRILREAKHDVSSWAGEIYFVYLPMFGRYSDMPGCSFAHAPPHAQFRHQILSVAEAAGLKIIDATPAFDAHPDSLGLWEFRLHGHYNEEGYKLVADTVLDSIRMAKKP